MPFRHPYPMPPPYLVLWFVQHDGDPSGWLSLPLASHTSHIDCRQTNCPHCHSNSKGIVRQLLIYLLVLLSPHITVCSFSLKCLTSVLHLIADSLFSSILYKNVVLHTSMLHPLMNVNWLNDCWLWCDGNHYINTCIDILSYAYNMLYDSHNQSVIWKSLINPLLLLFCKQSDFWSFCAAKQAKKVGRGEGI